MTLSALPLGLLVWAGAHWMSAGTPKPRMVTEVIPTPGADVAPTVAAPTTATIVATAVASTETLKPDTDNKPWRASGMVGAALTGAEAATVAAARTVPLIAPAGLNASPPDNSPVDSLPVHARHMVVMDDNGQVLAAKEPDAVVPIASLTKLMTAMVVLDARQDPQEELTIDDDDIDRLKHSKSRVRVGARLTRADALEMALIASENRAASALARHFPGGLAAFESAVQAKIRALGLTHTTLNDPTGLSPANLSTASEVARIAMAAARYPDIVRITSVKSSTVEISGRDRELRNTNHLVGAKGWDIRLSKTGFTNEAGRCLVMRLKQGIRTLTVVLLDTDGSAQRLQDASLIRRTLSGEPAPVERAAPARKHHKVRLS